MEFVSSISIILADVIAMTERMRAKTTMTEIRNTEQFTLYRGIRQLKSYGSY